MQKITETQEDGSTQDFFPQSVVFMRMHAPQGINAKRREAKPADGWRFW
jgi:hypothetical protein